MKPAKKEGRETYREDQYRVNIYHPGCKKAGNGAQIPLKYRKVELDKPTEYKKFLAFVDRTCPGWTAINVFGGLTRLYLRQINQKNR